MREPTPVAAQATPSIASNAKDASTLARGASVTLVGRLVGRGLLLVVQILLARTLGAGLFGLFALGWILFQTVGLLASLGLDNGAIRFGSEYWGNDEKALGSVISRTIALSILSGLLVGGAMFVTAPWLADQVFQKPAMTLVFRGFSIALLFFGVLRVASAATTVSQRMKFFVYSRELAQPAANFVLVVLFLLAGWSLTGAVVATILSFAAACVLALRYATFLFPSAHNSWQRSGPSTKQLLAFSFPTALTGTMTILVLRVDRLFVGYFGSPHDVAVYHVVTQILVLFTFTQIALNAKFSPMIAPLYQNHETTRLDALYKVSTKWGLYISLPFFLAFIFASREILKVGFGPEYSRGALVLVILLISTLVNVGTGPVGRLLVMTDRQNLWLGAIVGTLVLNILLSLLLIPRFSLIGAALASTISISCLFLAGLSAVKGILHIWPYDRRYLKGLLATLSAALSLFLLSLVHMPSPELKLFLTFTSSVCVFWGSFLLIGLDPEDREIIQSIQARLSRLG